MVATPDAADLDKRLLASIDDFLHGVQPSTFDGLLSNWDDIDKAFVDGSEAGTLDCDISSLAVGLSECMQLLCDAFLDLDLKSADLRQDLHHDLSALAVEESLTPSTPTSFNFRSPSPSLSERSPSPSSPTTAAYIPLAYTWLLSNLHNPYPPSSLRDEWAYSTNSERRLIDAWFIDVRKRIGWTDLLFTHSKATKAAKKEEEEGVLGKDDDVAPRRDHKDAFPILEPKKALKYKCRKDLIAAATTFFVHGRAGSTSSSTFVPLSAEAQMRFSLLEDQAKLLYHNKVNPQPSALALEATSQVKQWTPELEAEVKKIREEERKEKRRAASGKRKRGESEESDDTNEKRPRLSSNSPFGFDSFATSPASLVSSPTTSTFDSSSQSTTNLKRKRAFSSQPESSAFSTDPVSPSTKRLRTALNSAGISRCVSDPTPIPSQPIEPVTFEGYPPSMLDSWFSSTQSEGEFGFTDPFWDFDPVLRSDVFDSAPSTSGESSKESAETAVVPPVQSYPFSIDLADLSVFSNSRSTSISSRSSYSRSSSSYRSYSPSSPSPATPALSASGSLTEDDDENDSLFGGEELEDGVSVVGQKSTEEGVGAIIEARKKVSPTSASAFASSTNITGNDKSKQTTNSALSSLSLPFSNFPTTSMPTSTPSSTFDSSSTPTFDPLTFDPSTFDVNIDPSLFDFDPNSFSLPEGGLNFDLGLGFDSNFGLSLGLGEGQGQGCASGAGHTPKSAYDAPGGLGLWAGPTPTRETFASSVSASV